MGIRFQSIWTCNLSLFTHSNNIQTKVNNFMLYEHNVCAVSENIHTHSKGLRGGGGGSFKFLCQNYMKGNKEMMRQAKPKS